jgi:hypothetical protein
LQILNPPPPLYSDDVHGKPVPAVDWEVEGLAIRGKINLIYGASTAMKSWLAMSLGLHLAAGKPWLGRFNIPEARHVVYVDEEMGEDMMQRRLIQLTSGANLPKNDRRFVSFSYTGLRGNEGSVEMFLQYLKQLEIDPDVIIIDSLIRVIDGDENSNTDAAAFWRAMRRLSGGKRTIFPMHHISRVNRDGLPRGASDMLGGVDTGLLVRRKAGGLVLVEPKKARGDREAVPFVVSVASKDRNSPVVLSMAEDQPADRPTPEAIIIQHLKAGHSGERAGIVEAVKQGGFSEDAGDRTLRRLVDGGIVLKGGRGIYILPPEFSNESFRAAETPKRD